MKVQRNPWVAIMWACSRGRPLFLSVAELRALTRDEAIRTRAINDVTAIDPALAVTWDQVDPKRYPVEVPDLA